jgi:hypothetical protein
MSNLSISLMRKLIQTIDAANIPESYVKLFPVETEADIDQLVKDWQGIKGKTETAENDQIDAEIKAFAKGG